MPDGQPERLTAAFEPACIRQSRTVACVDTAEADSGMIVEAKKTSRDSVAIIPLPDGRECILCGAKDTDDDDFDNTRVMMWVLYWCPAVHIRSTLANTPRCANKRPCHDRKRHRSGPVRSAEDRPNWKCVRSDSCSGSQVETKVGIPSLPKNQKEPWHGMLLLQPGLHGALQGEVPDHR